MIDKLDMGVDRRAPWTREFGKVLEIADSPEWREKTTRDGGHYRKRIDLREVSGGELPVIVHMHNRHDWKADDKIELIETGGMSLRAMRETVSSMYHFPAELCTVMRLDLASDVEGTPVHWFREHTYIAMKQKQQSWMEQGSRTAQTIYAGIKPSQIRIYDKTGHRQFLLNRELRRMTREERQHVAGVELRDPNFAAICFERRWGYPRDRIITRVERQLGGGEPSRVFSPLEIEGAKRRRAQVGDLEKLILGFDPQGKTIGFDPFDRIVFAADAAEPQFGKKWRPEDKIAVLYLIDYAKRWGIENMRVYLRDLCRPDSLRNFAVNHRGRFYRAWRKYGPHILSAIGEGGSTRATVLQSYSRSIYKQLAA